MIDTIEGLSPIYTAALDTLRRGAPGLSDITRQALARSINMKVALAAQGEVTNMDRVRAFHETFGVPVLPSPCIPADRVKMRLEILDEERRELDEALEADDLIEVADALTDMAYLIYGTALEFGIDLNACFAEVHRSNMSKLGADGKPIYREDGKVLKGPSYSPPDLRAALSRNAA